MAKNYFNFLHFVLFFIFFTILPTQINAQCAGTDAQKIICDIENPANETLSLFSLLGGSPTPGGTWSGESNLKILDPTTGILHPQLITRGGTYRYTYTVPATSGCTNNKAVVTLTIGAFQGVGSQATVCNDSNFFNLFTAFDSNSMSPHSNGRWTDVNGRTLTNPSIYIGDITEKTTLQYTYTVPPVLACSTAEKSTTVFVTILIAPKPGTPENLDLCGTTDLAGYTNLDLDGQLTDQDKGGIWTGPGLTSDTDHNVNLKELFDISGPGEYTFTYKVLAVPDNYICKDKSSDVVITLEKRIDFTGSKIVATKDICESEISTATYSAKITEGPDGIPNGEYIVTFNVNGPVSGSEDVRVICVNGELNFHIRSAYFQQVGKSTITVTNIVQVAGKKLCTNIFSPFSTDLNVYPLPRLNGATITSTPTCQNKAGLMQINAPQLLDGNYRITYNINGDNIATGETAIIKAESGKASFEVPRNLNVKSGLSVITILNIVNITNPSPQCSNTANVAGNLIINPLPNATTVSVAVNNYCLNDPVSVAVSGLGNLTNVKISYTLSDSNSAALQTVTQVVTNGRIDFIIPAGLLLNSGNTKITLLNLTNMVTDCDSDLINVSDDFIINPIPVAPIATDQKFCKVDEAAIANLEPKGSQYKWYNSATSTTPLAATYILKTEDYYLRETSAAGCISEATKISVIVYDTAAPVMNDTPDFCGLANPTVQDLSNKTNVAGTVAWYDAVNGNLLPSSTPLVHHVTYYGYDLDGNTNCLSVNHIEVVVSLQDCDTSQYDFFVPDGFSPNGDNVNDTFRIPDIEFLYPNYTLEIYNRYGNGMYKGDKNKPAWDGMNYEQSGIAGGIAPNGVYFYVLHFNKDNKPPQQGRLYLNR
ncbi:gliding motility-associated C-terminal domain-containing protein [Flavobacterium sp. 17A]|uniref:Gliding motility-associated C-terminal domain-containing protein n=1 Tax=Flavobacterium potami TaxID=2872310 RepID=A0A9X1H9L3_9FLAO|nr:gliding motility-associated C-terminal domain-containing protein [Flavobacterium potami]MBZ4034459.1 gliding motility-associated C-terminal domain-containing protein [Flavobacterium potami]